MREHGPRETTRDIPACPHRTMERGKSLVGSLRWLCTLVHVRLLRQCGWTRFRLMAVYHDHDADDDICFCVGLHWMDIRMTHRISFTSISFHLEMFIYFPVATKGDRQFRLIQPFLQFQLVHPNRVATVPFFLVHARLRGGIKQLLLVC